MRYVLCYCFGLQNIFYEDKKMLFDTRKKNLICVHQYNCSNNTIVLFLYKAMKTFEEIAANNRHFMWLASMPFKAGFLASFTGGIASIPLVFDLKSVEWFNEMYVTAEMPPPEDLETWLEVGSA